MPEVLTLSSLVGTVNFYLQDKNGSIFEAVANMNFGDDI
jgi:hypothetical protein